LYTGRGKHAKKIFFVKSNPQNNFCENGPWRHRMKEFFDTNSNVGLHGNVRAFKAATCRRSLQRRRRGIFVEHPQNNP
jgi:hypothetical protein